MDDKVPPLRLRRVYDDRATLMRKIGGESWDWLAMVRRLGGTGEARRLAERSSTVRVTQGPDGTLYFTCTIPRRDIDLITTASMRGLMTALEDDAGAPVDLAVMLDDA